MGKIEARGKTKGRGMVGGTATIRKGRNGGRERKQRSIRKGMMKEGKGGREKTEDRKKRKI